MTWKTIDSAPRDTRILLWDGEWVAAGTYVEYDSMGWIMDSNIGDESSYPTHWQPLPAPPSHDGSE